MTQRQTDSDGTATIHSHSRRSGRRNAGSRAFASRRSAAVTAALATAGAALVVAGPGPLGTAHAATLSPGHDNSACPAAEPLLSSSTSWDHTRVTDGVTYRHVTAHDSRGPVQLNELQVTLGHGVTIAPLSGELGDREPLTSLVRHHGVVAATNGPYFSFSYGGPTVPFVAKGAPVVMTTVPLRVAGIGTDGRAESGYVSLAGSVTAPVPSSTVPVSPTPTSPTSPTPTPTPTATPPSTGTTASTVPLAAVNPSAAVTGLSLYTAAWGPNPVPLVNGARSLGVVDGVTTQVAGRNHRPPAGGQLLVATGSTATRWLAGVAKGSALRAKLAIRSTAAVPFSSAYGVGTQVVVTPGVVGTNLYCSDSEPESAHTAIGWSDHGRHLILLAVAGASSSVKHQHGVDENQMSQFMVTLGAEQAYALDGGGSTELLTHSPGHSVVVRTGQGTGTGQRPVPVGVGVVAGSSS